MELINTTHDLAYDRITEIYCLLVSEQYDRLEALLNNDPTDQAVLYRTRLECLKGQPEKAIKKLGVLLKESPTNPYYRLPAIELFDAKGYLTVEDLVFRYNSIAEDSHTSPDVLAKIGYSATLRGLWSYGMPYFVKAIAIISRQKRADAVLLSPNNAPALSSFLASLNIMDGLGVEPDLNLAPIPIEILGRLICILLTANEMEIAEASHMIARIITRHPELRYRREPKDTLPLAIKYAPGWIALKLPYSNIPIIHWN